MIQLKSSNMFIFVILLLRIVKGDGFSLNCTFDNGFCQWMKDDDWAKHEVESYIYIETSHQFPVENKNARILSSEQRPGPFCLTFLYKMYGAYIGALNVYMRTDSEDNNRIFTKENDIGNTVWQKAVIGENSNADFEIIIEGYIYGGLEGGIAIDDISITYSFCSVVLDCNFNSGLCNWVQDYNDDFNWTLRSGNTPSFSIGPSTDHTSGNGNYIYIETSNANAKDYARLISPLMEEGKYCFSFWYHMSGKDTSTLIVKKVEQEKNTNELFVISGSEEAKWIQKTIFIQSGTYFKIILEGRVKDRYIAVDDVHVTSCQDCKNPQPSNGSTNSSNFQYGSAVKIMCHSGYNLTGSSILTCQSGGTWSANVACDPIDCLIPNITNGMMSGPRNNTTYNQTVDIACEDGYFLVGNKRITCQADGTWSAPPLCDYHETTNTNSLTAVYVTVPLVLVSLDIAIIAIIWRKRIIRYFRIRSSLGKNMKEQHQSGTVLTHSENIYENQSYPKGNVSQDDAYAETANGRHETAQDGNPQNYIIADAEIATTKEIEHIYNHTSQSEAPVIDNTYSHLSKSKGMSSSAYDTATFSLSGNPSFQFSTNRKSKTYGFLKKAKESCRLELRPNMQDEQDSEYVNVQARGTIPTYIDDYAHLSVGADRSRPKLKHGREDNE